MRAHIRMARETSERQATKPVIPGHSCYMYMYTPVCMITSILYNVQLIRVYLITCMHDYLYIIHCTRLVIRGTYNAYTLNIPHIGMV